MRQIVILTEKASARIVVQFLAESRNLLDRVRVIQHEGKTDLEASIPRKIGHWRAAEPPRFIILRDNDGGNCARLKGRLRDIVPENSHSRVKIRIVMHELENWYLGDFKAIAAAGLLPIEKIDGLEKRAKYRDPERLANAKQEFKRLVGGRGQIELANLIGPHLVAERNRAKSLHNFVAALDWAASEQDTRG